MRHTDYAPAPPPRYAIGDRVRKDGGDYTFSGAVVGVITKLSGAIRYVVESTTPGCKGLLLILSEAQLKPQSEES